MLVTLPYYLIRELGKALGLSLLIYTFMMLGMTSGQLIRDGVGIFTVLSLLPNMFPLVSSFVLPFSVITGILICYGKLSSGNEFVASQASGIHPGWLAAPALLVAMLSSLICLYLNADVLTESVLGIEKRVFADRTEIINAQLSRPGSFTYPLKKGHDERKSLTICRLPASWLEGGEKKPGALAEKRGVDVANFVWRRNPNPSDGHHWDPRYPMPDERYLAMWHKIKVEEDPVNDTLVMTPELKEFLLQDIDDKNYSRLSSSKANLRYALEASNVEIHIVHERIQYWGIDKLLEKKRDITGPYIEEILPLYEETTQVLVPVMTKKGEDLLAALEANPNLPERDQKIATLQSSLLNLDKAIGGSPGELFEALEEVREAVLANNGTLDENTELRFQAIEKYHEEHGDVLRDLRRIQAELHTKLAYSFGCIAFACIGIPFGLMARRDSKILGFAVGFFFGGAYILTVLTLQRTVYDGLMQWYILWTPAIVVVGLGAALWFRVTRNMR